MKMSRLFFILLSEMVGGATVFVVLVMLSLFFLGIS